MNVSSAWYGIKGSRDDSSLGQLSALWRLINYAKIHNMDVPGHFLKKKDQTFVIIAVRVFFHFYDLMDRFGSKFAASFLLWCLEH